MKGPSLYPSSKVHQLRQLMSLDSPLVNLTSSSITKNNKKSGSHKLKIRPPFTTTRNKPCNQARTRNVSSSPPCLICTCPGSNNALINNKSQQRSSVLVSLLMEGGCSVLEESWVFCKVCLGTITKLLRLVEEVDDIKARISAVLKLRGNVGRFVRPKCGVRLTQRSSLNKHMRDIHSLDIPKKYFKHFCPICKKFFGSDLVFQAHSHPNPSDPEKVLYICHVCFKTFNNRPCFHNHKALHQGRQKVPHRCYFCSKPYQNRKCLQSHMRTHPASHSRLVR